MVYDNDCKYPLFKARLTTEEERKEMESQAAEEASEKTTSTPKENAL